MSFERRIDTDLPWLATEFAGWSIIGMNHYSRPVGLRWLYVAMTKGQRCIKEEGPDDIDLWKRLAAQARAA